MRYLCVTQDKRFHSWNTHRACGEKTVSSEAWTELIHMKILKGPKVRQNCIKGPRINTHALTASVCGVTCGVSVNSSLKSFYLTVAGGLRHLLAKLQLWKRSVTSHPLTTTTQLENLNAVRGTLPKRHGHNLIKRNLPTLNEDSAPIKTRCSTMMERVRQKWGVGGG